MFSFQLSRQICWRMNWSVKWFNFVREARYWRNRQLVDDQPMLTPLLHIFNISKASTTVDVLMNSFKFSGCWEQRSYDSVQIKVVLFIRRGRSWRADRTEEEFGCSVAQVTRLRFVKSDAEYLLSIENLPPPSLHRAARIRVTDLNFLDSHFRVSVRSTVHCTESTVGNRFSESKTTSQFNTKFIRKVHPQTEKDESVGRSNFFRSTHRAVHGLSGGTQKTVDWSAVSGSDPSR